MSLMGTAKGRQDDDTSFPKAEELRWRSPTWQLPNGNSQPKIYILTKILFRYIQNRMHQKTTITAKPCSTG